MTALPPYGGIRLPFAMGAVVLGVPWTFHTPLSGQVWPVLASVPIGALFVAASDIVLAPRFNHTRRGFRRAEAKHASHRESVVGT